MPHLAWKVEMKNNPTFGSLFDKVFTSSQIEKNRTCNEGDGVQRVAKGDNNSFLIKHSNFLNLFSIAMSKARNFAPATGKENSEKCASSCCNNNNQARKISNDKQNLSTKNKKIKLS